MKDLSLYKDEYLQEEILRKGITDAKKLVPISGSIYIWQGYEEPTGTAKFTPAFNLPCRYVLHTVGPVVRGKLVEKQRKELASCYRSCLELADSNGPGRDQHTFDLH